MITLEQAAKPWRAPGGDIRDALDKIEKRIEKYFENDPNMTPVDAEKMSNDLLTWLDWTIHRAEKMRDRVNADYREICKHDLRKPIENKPADA